MAPVLAALIDRNRSFLRSHPQTPALYDAGVRYQRDQAGVEDWCPIPEVLRRRAADCKSLACWRVAELQALGEYAAAAWIKQGCHDPGSG